MKLGPTRWFGRDALRRVLARNEPIVIQIFRDLWAMQAQAAESSGYARLRRTIPLLFGEKNLKAVCFDSFYFNQALKQAHSACLRARNELVASAFA